jgi:UDP-glucuronate 4-epimerase
MKILVTGAAGFIGAATSKRLLSRGDEVVGIDNINDYYDVNLKQARLDDINMHPASGNFTFLELAVEDRVAMENLFKDHGFERVVHLAAQAGVRYSIENPHAYVDSNIVGFMNVLEGCRHHHIQHLVYASSSSVYGMSKIMPFSEEHNVDHPVSLYAASKKANELMAHTYSHLYGLPTTGLRFFTVYGPWGRPDMAPFKFTKAILNDDPIDVYNYGNHRRDFTYIDDIVEGVVRSLDTVATINNQWDPNAPSASTSTAPYRVYNIGAQTPVNLLDFIEAIERAVGKKVTKNMLPMQPGDVPDTYADVSALMTSTDYRPQTKLEDGIKAFVDWYRQFYKL